MYTIKEVKENQKVLAKEIKKLKGQRKKVKNGAVAGLWMASWTYRHWHIAYCLFRGRKMEEIERTNREDNYPSKSRYNSCLEQIKPSEKFMEVDNE